MVVYIVKNFESGHIYGAFFDEHRANDLRYELEETFPENIIVVEDIEVV